MADDITQAYLNQISAGINTAFSTIQSQLVSQALSQSLPLIGDKLDDAVNRAQNGLKYLDNVKTQVTSTLATLAQAANATAQTVQANINAALSPYGLQVTVTKDGDMVRLNFGSTTAQGHTTTYTQDLATDLGVGPLGVHVDGEAQASLNYFLNLGVGYDEAGGFFVDTTATNEIRVTAQASAATFSGDAQMGFLNFNAADNGSSLTAQFLVNLSDGDGRLHLNEMGSAFLSAMVSATADISINLNGNMGSEWFPSVDAQLNVDWAASGTASSSGFLQGGTKPTVSIDNVTIDLGTFVEDFIKPTLEKLSPILQPLNVALAVLNSDIKALKVVPGWSTIFDHTGKVENGVDVPDGKITLLDFLKMADSDMDLAPILNVMSTVDKIIDWVEFFTLHSFGPDDYTLGDFAITDDIRNASFVLENVAPQITVGAETLIAALNGLSGGGYDTEDPVTHETGQAIITSLITGPDFAFPILSNPSAIFGLLTGKTVDLMTFQLPHVELGISQQELARFDVYPGVAIKLFGALELILDMSGGFDTRGLSQFIDTLLDTGQKDYAAIFNGFYLSDYDSNGDERPEISFTAGFDIVGAFDAAIFEVGGGGGIDGTIEFDLNNALHSSGAPAGRIYLDKLVDALAANPFSIFTTSGRITAGLTAYAELLNVEVWRYNSPRVTLGSFSFDNNPVLPGQNPATLPGLGDLTGASTNVLEVNIGLRADQRDIADKVDDGESVEIGLAAGKITIGALGEQQSFAGVTRIEAHGNAGDDQIVVSEAVSVAVNASGGAGDDLILGGSGNDTLNGDANRDYLEGGAGDDELWGGTEDDILVGADGGDQLHGGDGRDTASYFQASEGVFINLATGVTAGDEALGDTFDSIEIIEGSSHNDTMVGGGASVTFVGLSGDDSLTGGSQNDVLVGNEGADTLDGGGGVDVLVGGKGDDSYYVDTLSDQVHENRLNEIGASADGGRDSVYASVDYSLGVFTLDNGKIIHDLRDIEDLYLVGAARVGTGNALNNKITGTSGKDSLTGLGGNDSLIGGLDNDTLVGGSSNDTLQGDAGNDQLYGEADADTLYGGAGNDTLDGGDGVDRMEGGTNNDTYYVSSAADVVVEAGNSGSDTVRATVDYNLAFGVSVEVLETAQASGITAIELRGNEVAQIVRGNAGANVLEGLGGADTIEGGDGVDKVTYRSSAFGVTIDLGLTTQQGGDAQGDIYSSIEIHEGSSWEDTLKGNALANHLRGLGDADLLYGYAGNDSLVGGAGLDTIDGGTDADTMVGGADSDTYYVDSLSDVVDEVSDGGSGSHDLIITGLNYSIANNAAVEDLTITGSANYAQGNGNANIIVATNHADTIDGGGGSDYMVGKDGDDTYYIDSLGDEIGENSDEGTDLIKLHVSSLVGATQPTPDPIATFVMNTWASNVEHLDMDVETTTWRINVTGNDLNNRITANQRENVINALGGNDTVIAGGGQDSIYGGDGNDRAEFAWDFQSNEDLFDGGNDTDTLKMDWSAATSNIVYYSDANSSKYYTYVPSGGANTVMNFANVERFALYGGAGTDDLRGGALGDTLVGGANHDRLLGYAGTGTYDGGSGVDFVEATVATTASLQFNLSLSASQTAEQVSNLGTAIETRWKGIEYVKLTTGSGDDMLDARLDDFTNTRTWGEDGNEFYAGGGADTFMINWKSAGYHYFDGQGGTDKLYMDWREATSGITFYTDTYGQRQYTYNSQAGENSNVHYLNVERFELYGGSGNDDLRGGDIDDTLSGGAGTDRLWGGTGKGVYNGGDGTDVVVATIATAVGLDFNLSFSAAQATEKVSNAGTAIETRWKGIEVVDLTTGAGNDTLDTRLDTFTNITAVWHEDGNDFLAGAGDDTFLTNYNSAGYNYFDGSTGTDKVYIDWSAATGNISFYTDTYGQKQMVYNPSTGYNSVVHYVAAERFEIYGGVGNDDLRGGALDDTLSGGNGTDRLIGGAGKGVYDGGEGLDHVEATVATTSTRHFNLSLSASQTAQQISNQGTSIETRWKGIEFVKLTTGAGNDVLDARLDTFTSTRVWNEDGNEFAAGDGDDTFMINWKSAGYHYFQAQGGTDKVFIDWSEAASGMSYYSDAAGQKYTSYNPSAGENSVVHFLNVERFEIYGGSGDDDIRGGALDDTLSGGNGTDRLLGATGTGVFNGGDGMDRVVADIKTGGNVDLGLDFSLALAATQAGQVTVNAGTGVETKWQNVEVVQLTTGAGNDTLDARLNTAMGTGSYGVDGNTWSSNNGDDHFITNYNALGTHEWSAGAGSDTLTMDWSAATGNISYFSDAYGQKYYVYAPTFGNNTNVIFHDVERFDLTGGNGYDDLRGGAFADTLSGGASDDFLRGYEGAGTYVGGTGDDRVEATIASVAGKNFSLSLAATQTAEQMANAGTTFETRWSGIEIVKLTLGAGNDTLDARMSVMTNTRTWSEGGDYFDGGAGNDTLKINFNARGNHYFEGGDGTDTLLLDYSGATGGISYNGTAFYSYDPGGGYNTSTEFHNVERFNLTGGNGNDNLVGGAQTDTLRGNGGDDNLDGSDGVDTVVYSGASTNYVVTENGDGSFAVVDQRAASDGADTLRNIENVTFSDKTIRLGNKAPTDVSLSTTVIAENSANGTVVGSLSAVDPDAGDTSTFTLMDNAGGRFALVGGNIVVANSTLLNAESTNPVSVTVRATDTSGASVDKVIAITLSDVDEFNVGAISDATSAADTVAENAAINTAVGIKAKASDADATTNAITYTLTNNADGRFKIDSNGTVRTAKLLDREVDGPSQTITVKATSADGSSSTKNFVIAIADVDEFDVGTISDTNNAANSVLEGAAVNSLVGLTVSAADADATTNAVTYSLTNDAGGRFAVDAAGVVRLVKDIDREIDGTSFTVTVKATSADGSSSTKDFVIAVGNRPGVTITGTSAANLIDATHSVGSQPKPTGEEDSISGAGGNDTIAGLGGKDTIDGGSGIDTAVYSEKTAAVVVTLNGATAATVTVGGLAEDSIKNIENVTGGSAADKLTGDTLANVLVGGASNDTLKGAAGNDTLLGGTGNDSLDGGADADTADYADKTTAVTVTLNGATNAFATIAGGTEKDTLKNIENVTGGSGADVLTGDTFANFLIGNAANDTLAGGAANDTLVGGVGKDSLTGGANADTFRFDAALTSANVDVITDFVAADDTIELDNGVMLALGNTWTQAMFLSVASGNKATKLDQRIIYDKQTGNLWYDADGNTTGGADPLKIATLTTHPTDVTWQDFQIV